jgi:hypothetical protein
LVSVAFQPEVNVLNYQLRLVTLGAFAFTPVAAEATVYEASGLDQSVTLNSPYNVVINGTSDFQITDTFGFAGTDSNSNSYYNRSVSISGLATSTVGTPASTAGAATSAPNLASETLWSQNYTPYSYTYQSGSGDCGKNCSYPIYSTATYFSESRTGNLGELFVPASITVGGAQLLGFVDLTISDPGSNTSSASVVLNGYDFASAVPEPSTWILMALGFAGLGLYRVRTGQKLSTAA